MAFVPVLITTLLGGASALWFVRAARRYAVVDRLRHDRDRAARRVPAWMRFRLERALDAAALDVPPERALSTWIWSVTVAGALGVGFGGPQIGFVLALVVALGVPI